MTSQFATVSLILAHYFLSQSSCCNASESDWHSNCLRRVRVAVAGERHIRGIVSFAGVSGHAQSAIERMNVLESGRVKAAVPDGVWF